MLSKDRLIADWCCLVDLLLETEAEGGARVRMQGESHKPLWSTGLHKDATGETVVSRAMKVEWKYIRIYLVFKN